MGLAVTIEVTHWPLPRPTTGRGGKYLAPLTRPAPAPTGPGCWSPGLLEPKTASGCTGRGHHRDKINRPLRGKGPGKGAGTTGDQMIATKALFEFTGRGGNRDEINETR